MIKVMIHTHKTSLFSLSNNEWKYMYILTKQAYFHSVVESFILFSRNETFFAFRFAMKIPLPGIGQGWWELWGECSGLHRFGKGCTMWMSTNQWLLYLCIMYSFIGGCALCLQLGIWGKLENNFKDPGRACSGHCSKADEL